MLISDGGDESGLVDCQPVSSGLVGIISNQTSRKGCLTTPVRYKRIGDEPTELLWSISN